MSSRKIKTGNTTLLSQREKELWHAFKKLGEMSLALVAGDLEANAKLSDADFGILSRLEDLGGGTLLQSELLASLGWQRSRLSHQLTRMESRNLLRRKDSSTGAGRGNSVVILPTGRKVIAAARPIHAASVRKHILQYIHKDEEDMIVTLAKRLSSREPVGKNESN